MKIYIDRHVLTGEPPELVIAPGNDAAAQRTAKQLIERYAISGCGLDPDTGEVLHVSIVLAHARADR